MMEDVALKNGAMHEPFFVQRIVTQIEEMLQQQESAVAYLTLYNVAQGTATEREIDTHRMKLILAGLFNSNDTLPRGVGDVVLSATDEQGNFTGNPFKHGLPEAMAGKPNPYARKHAILEEIERERLSREGADPKSIPGR